MSLPTYAGLCRYCLRATWSSGGGKTGLLSTAADREPGACDTCVSWRARNGGADPRARRGNVAEQVPAERPEDEPAWRRRGDLRCVLVPLPPSAFEPEPDPDDEVDEQQRAEQRDARSRAARGLCAACPVRDLCRATALDRGYDGLWGGALFDGPQWRDLVTGETGPTRYAPKAQPVPA